MFHKVSYLTLLLRPVGLTFAPLMTATGSQYRLTAASDTELPA